MLWIFASESSHISFSHLLWYVLAIPHGNMPSAALSAPVVAVQDFLSFNFHRVTLLSHPALKVSIIDP